MNERMKRRAFLRDAIASGLGLRFLAKGASAAGYPSHEKLGVALVGVSGRGRWFVQTIPRMEDVVALCDVDDRRAAEAYGKFPGVKKYHDFRRMLEEMDRAIDAVIVATPDNTHAVIAATAMGRGKHVFCEKPLAHDVHEARVLRRIAAREGVATQMGNQGTASRAFRRSVGIIQAGLLGEVREVLVWNSAGGSGHRDRPGGSEPVPSHFKWDLWLGPAADRPFHPDWLRWHGWRDFGTGNLGNWASHSANLAFKALRVDSLWKPPGADPKGGEADRRIRVRAEVSGIHADTFPRWEKIRYDIPARGGLPPVTLQWYNGSRGPGVRDRIEGLLGRKLDWGDAGERKWRDHGGTLIVGSKGKLHSIAHNTTLTLIPADRFAGVEASGPSLPRSPGHEREWFLACRGGEPAMSNFDYSGPLTEFLMVGNIATRFDGELLFDPVACKIVDHPAADRLVRRAYRKGWSL